MRISFLAAAATAILAAMTCPSATAIALQGTDYKQDKKAESDLKKKIDMLNEHIEQEKDNGASKEVIALLTKKKDTEVAKWRKKTAALENHDEDENEDAIGKNGTRMSDMGFDDWAHKESARVAL